MTSNGLSNCPTLERFRKMILWTTVKNFRTTVFQMRVRYLKYSRVARNLWTRCGKTVWACNKLQFPNKVLKKNPSWWSHLESGSLFPLGDAHSLLRGFSFSRPCEYIHLYLHPHYLSTDRRQPPFAVSPSISVLVGFLLTFRHHPSVSVIESPFESTATGFIDREAQHVHRIRLPPKIGEENC